jgi:hypothetical protein
MDHPFITMGNFNEAALIDHRLSTATETSVSPIFQHIVHFGVSIELV